MGVIRTILIICLAYYGFKYVMKFLLPFLLKYIAGKATDKFTGGFNQQNQEQQRPEGDVVIEKNVNKKSKLDSSVAEDVDFEEVE